jgi:hypothetical protein
MKSVILSMTMLVFFGFLITTSAQAFDATSGKSGPAKYSGAAGTCPAGTCGRTGGPKAKNLSFCSAANCKGKAK